MAGTNDFVQHNPTEANQEPNSTFAADSLTTGGIGVDAIMPSPWMNARWYQDSTVAGALMQMLANKGYNVSVANLATLISVFANILTDADVLPPLTSVGYSPTPAFNAAASNGFDIVLGGNVTSSTLTGQNIGQILTFVVTQTSGGGATFVPPTNVNGWLPINPAANSVTVQQFIVKEDSSIVPVVTASIPITGTVTVASRSFVPTTSHDYSVTMSSAVPSGAVVVVSVEQGSDMWESAGPPPTGSFQVGVSGISGSTVWIRVSNTGGDTETLPTVTFNCVVVQ